MENKTGQTSFKYLEDGFIDYGEYKVETDLEPFEFEKYDLRFLVRWAHQHPEFACIVGVIYIVAIFGIQHFMKNRDAFNLKKELFFWNLAVGIFSICGFIRIAPELFNKLSQPNGFYRSVCVQEGITYQFSFWGIMFAVSKFFELVDTIFIVLRKKPLVFLQWYHHFITVIGTWVILPYTEPISMYCLFLNYGVHSMMYPYFALKVLDFKIPRTIAKGITTCQLSQMIIVLFVTVYSVLMFYGEGLCYRHPVSINIQMAGTISFNVLFGRLFYQTVLKRNKAKIE